jgi:diguanylate cyclase (GGDEF)-like protein
LLNCDSTAENPQEVWLSASGAPLPNGGAIVSVRNISARKQKEAALLQQALYDELTQLPKRNLLSDRVNRVISRPLEGTEPLMAILFLDLDRFKVINDNLGHAAGDQLLQELGQRFQQHIRPEDTLARIGGDEFVIFLEQIMAVSTVIEVAERLQTAMTQPFFLQQQEVQVDISIGIAFGPSGYRNFEEWLHNADIAMYEAKNTPNLSWCIFDDAASQREQHERLQVELDLRKALENDELCLHYQPIVNMRSRALMGFEALVRWQHPTRGLLPPTSFIPVAEETGLIVPLGWWVLQEGCRQMQVWREVIPATQSLKLSVNMSSKQFSQRGLIEQFKRVLRETGFSPHRLTIEITEGVLIENSDSIVETLKALQQMGVQLSIDDFGTGYSSLSYLHQFPFNTLKIDRSFIENADQDFDKLEILQSVIRLAWNLGLDVVAEGVETEKHYAQLLALRCEAGQGYLFAHPLEPEATDAMLREQFTSDL